MVEKLKDSNLLRYFSYEELEKIFEITNLYLKAEILVQRLFEDKVDKAGKPYIGHLVRVSEKLDDVTEKIAGLLHDTIEDTEITCEDLINIGFSKEIVDIVKLVTSDDIDKTNLSEDERLAIYYKKIDYIIKSGNIHAIRLKEADISDNYDKNRLKELPEEKQKWFYRKYDMPLKRLREEIDRVIGCYDFLDNR